MSLSTKDHRNGAKLIPAYIQEEVKAAVAETEALRRATSTREAILKTLRGKHGWSDEITLSPDAKISITSRKGEIGLCVQTGNMSRFYADLLKLEYLFHEGMIQAAVYVVPVKAVAKRWGENIANFERFTNEVKIFSKIIQTPLLIIGIGKP
ncbi:MAG: BglII/BstYI family type II restriction endonuclease [Chthoniobacterales bacterium]